MHHHLLLLRILHAHEHHVHHHHLILRLQLNAIYSELIFIDLRSSCSMFISKVC